MDFFKKLGIKLSDKQKFFSGYVVYGFLGSLIFFVLLFKTKFLIFSIFPIMISFGIAARIYTQRIKSYEKNLYIFLDDLKDLLIGGMNIVTAIEVTTKHDYGALNHPIKKIAAQIKIGIPFDVALDDVFGNIDSKTFKQITQIISETTKIGGNVIKIFTSISDYVRSVNEMIDERKSKTFSTVFSSYFMFFVFIAIILIIQVVFLPMLTTSTLSLTGESEMSGAMENINFNKYFLYLIVIQGLFAGPTIGLISENNFVAGIKHSIILIGISVPLYVIVSAIFL